MNDRITNICGEADEDDDVINGVVHFKSTKKHDEIMWTVQDIINALRKRYKDFFGDFDIGLSLNDVNFDDGWLDYSIEGKQETDACVYWKKEQGVELIPTPESKVGVFT